MTSRAHSKTTKKSKSAAEPGAKKGGRNELEDEFLQVMQPRTKKGPSWKDDEPVPVASTSATATSTVEAAPKKAKKSKKDKNEVDAMGEDQPVPQQEPEASAEPVSDMDWLRRHTTMAQLEATSQEKVFEQSEDEAVEDDEDDSDVRALQ